MYQSNPQHHSVDRLWDLTQKNNSVRHARKDMERLRQMAILSLSLSL